MPTNLDSCPWWRHLRFSVRSLMVLILVIGGSMGGMILFLRRARVQHEAVVAIEKAGGEVNYDAWTRDWGPGWFERLVDAIGIDYFEQPVHVSLDGFRTRLSQVSETELVSIEQLARLEFLDLSRTRVPDSGLVHLEGLANLRVLGLNQTRVTDSGLQHIRKLRHLQTLFLAGTDVTDAGLVHLRQMKSIRGVDLRDTKVTESGVRALRQALPQALVAR